MINKKKKSITIYFTPIYFVQLCIHNEYIYTQELFEVGSSTPCLPGVGYSRLRKIQLSLCLLSFSQLDNSLTKADLIISLNVFCF